ncbi:MAG: ComEC/Rec2 family competence protein [Candidatus Omnitrophota bacterium]
MKRVIPWPTVCVCLGIIFANAVRCPWTVFFYAAVFLCCASMAVIAHRRLCGTLLLAAFFCVGGALLAGREVMPEDSIGRFPADAQKRNVQLEGVIVSDPETKPEKTTFRMAVESFVAGAQRRQVSGTVLVRSVSRDGLSYGDRIIARGRMSPPSDFQLSRRLSYREFLARKGIYTVLTVRKRGKIERVGRNKGNPLIAFPLKVKARLQETIVRYMPRPQESILSALLLGSRERFPDSVKEMFIKTGTVHIIAISGLHVGIISVFVFFVLGAFRIPKNISCGIVIVVTTIFCVIAGARPSVVRATIMAVVLFAGYALERESDIYNSLSLAALILLTVNPYQIFEIGFQLSFISVLSIVWIAPIILSLFPDGIVHRSPVRGITRLFSVSSAAWLGVSPLVAFYFGMVSPIAIIANMVIVPYMAIVIASGLIFVIAASISPALGSIFSASCTLAINVLLMLVTIFFRIPAGYKSVRCPSLFFIILCYILIFFILKSINTRKSLIHNKLHNIV